MNDTEIIKRLISQFGYLYSTELGINVKTKNEKEIFKWFLASILFGKRISENIAIKTYREFEKAGILGPSEILKAGWDKLVQVLDAGGYVRYDFSTATKLLEISRGLLDKYGENPLIKMHEIAKDKKELESTLQSFKGIGPVTTNIFLRELRTVWKKADPEPLPVVKKLARKYKIDLNKFNRKTVKFIRLEAALIRIRKKYKN
jgi:endonuclease III